MDDVKDELETDMNPSNPGDHCPEAERNTRTIQERIRVGYYRLPYNWLPRVLVKQLALVSVDMLNVFPVKGGVSSYYSPNMIMKGKGLDYKKHCQIPFGAYVQVNNDPRFKNTFSPRALDAIYVKPNGNAQGGHTVMDLNSGKLIDRPRVIEVPITPTIIKAVERI